MTPEVITARKPQSSAPAANSDSNLGAGIRLMMADRTADRGAHIAVVTGEMTRLNQWLLELFPALAQIG